MATPETIAGLKESALSLQENEARLEELRSKSEASEARAQELRDKFDIDCAEMVKNVRKDTPDLKDIKAQIRDANKQEAVKDAKEALASAKAAAVRAREGQTGVGRAKALCAYSKSLLPHFRQRYPLLCGNTS